MLLSRDHDGEVVGLSSAGFVLTAAALYGAIAVVVSLSNGDVAHPRWLALTALATVLFGRAAGALVARRHAQTSRQDGSVPPPT